MRKALFLIVLGWCTLSCYSVNRDCDSFHAGTFKFTNVINGNLETSTFIRDSLFEIEMFNKTKDTSSIRWVNNCEFILTALHPKTNQEKKPIRIRIIETDASGYFFEYGLVGDTKNTQRGYAQKIK